MYLTLKYKLTKSLINCKISNCKINFGLIAQLVERRVRNAEARGSNPLKSTKIKYCVTIVPVSRVIVTIFLCKILILHDFS